MNNHAIETDDLFTGRLPILKALEKLRLRLLDLTLHNRLLNFKHSPGKCIQFVEASPNAIFRRLMEGTDKKILLLPIPEPHRNEWANVAGRLTKPDAKEYAKIIGVNPSFELAPTNNNANNVNNLRAIYYPEDLARYCRKLSREMKSALEETGAHMLFLVFGFLEFPDKGSEDRTITAPLISVPVTIEKGDIDRETRNYRYYISYSGEELSANLSLHEKLRQDYGFNLPIFNEDEVSPDDYFNEIQIIVKNRHHWKLKRQMTLALLSFTKMLLVRDIDPAKWPILNNGASALADHPIVRMVFEGNRNDSDADVCQNLGEDYNVDEHELNNLPLIYDADSSQHSALIDALSGRNMVIEGPPGTGKSQTITNLIAATITEGKKVLFLSEKMAALEVVKKRLTLAGLDDFCLELHSNKTQKKRVLDSLENRKVKSFSLPPALSAQLTALEEKRQSLKAYADLLNSVMGNAQGLTIHSVVWRTERYRQASGKQWTAAQGITFSRAHELTDAEFKSLYETLVHVCRLYQQIDTYGPENLFWGFSPTVLMPGDELKIEGLLKHFLPQFEEFQEAFKSASSYWEIEDLKLGPKKAKELIDALDSVNPDKHPEMSRTILPRLYSSSGQTAIMAEATLHKFDEKLEYVQNLRLEIGERLRRPNKISITDSDTANIIYDDLRALGLTELSCKELEALAITIINVAADLHSALGTIEECGQILGIASDGKASTAKKILAIVDIAKAAPFDLLQYRHTGLKKLDIGDVISKARDELHAIKCEEAALSETMYLDLLPTENELVNAILILREGDTWYRIFQTQWRKACRTHRILDKTKSKKSGKQRHYELERLYSWQKAASNWNAEQTYKDALGTMYQGANTKFDQAIALVSWINNTRLVLAEAGIEESAFDAYEGSNANIFTIANCHSRLESAFAVINRCNDLLENRLSIAQAIRKNIHEADSLQQLEDSLDHLGTMIKIAADRLLTWSPEHVSVAAAIRAVTASANLPSAIEAVNYDTNAKELLGIEFCSVDTNTLPAWAALSYCQAVHNLNLFPAISLSLISDMVDTNHKNVLARLRIISSGWDIVDEFCHKMGEYGNFDLTLWTGEKYYNSKLLSALIIRTMYAAQNIDKLLPWVQYLQQSTRARERWLGDFVSLLEDGRVGPEYLPDTFGYRFYFSITSRLFNSYQVLEQFAGSTHETIRSEFANLDRNIIKLRGQECAHKAAQRSVPPRGTGGTRLDDKTDLTLLNYLFPQTRPRISIRKMIKQAGRAIQALKPCFMMGPQAIAQFLEPGSVKFDIVVMDEASQLKPEEAIGAIARGKQLIVVGDPKQLPPTTFFDRLSLTMEDGEDEGQQAAALISQSILDICMGHFQPLRTLRWHYRSRHESLIAFSNHNFYKNLIIFPSPYPKGKFLGVHYHYIVNGIYQDQMNLIEAKHVCDAVIDHMLNHKDDSLGVVTLNLKQRDLIEELLEQRYRNLQKTEDYRTRWDSEGMGFFVKNLENVQGDERDIIFISSTFGKPQGANVVRQNFGPISRADGWRRLNVLFTRARKAVRVFTSMQPEDIVVDANTPLGTKTFHDYLDYARSGILADITPTGGEPESDFEASVINVLRNHGFEVEPQLGVAGFRIDIAVKHPKYISAYLAAIECDGATYHSGTSVRDRDRIRQEILESLGWKNRIWRIWSTDWFRNPGRETAKLIAFLKEITNTPLDGAYFVKSDAIAIPTAPSNVKAQQMTLEGLGVSIIGTEDDEVEAEVGDTIYYVNAEHAKDEIRVRITAHENDPTKGLISKGNPLAQAILGASVNDEFVLPDRHGRRNYIIKKIIKMKSQNKH